MMPNEVKTAKVRLEWMTPQDPKWELVEKKYLYKFIMNPLLLVSAERPMDFRASVLRN